MKSESLVLTPLLTIDILSKSFGDRPLLAIENFQLQQSSAYVLTGMNGVGKTVLLRILAGLEKADILAWHFMGQPQVTRAYPAVMREAIVYVHQHPIMLNMSVAQNVSYGLRVRRYAKAEVAERTEQALLWAGLWDLRNRMPQGLSGGEKQKIALARAKILQPKLLLLDEPSANLDGQAREQIIALIPTLVAAETSVVMACHDRDLINLPSVHHVKLRDGRIEERTANISRRNS
ncbi:ATP-binding cassette domain-containing protein [Undibacterium sp. Di24W]|uniref:ATP-binding cassette domain-containing protein n=1 Tax=Undibacterium sp. Di24W TaxID=3413033 RepID=UPI003BF1B058